MPGQSKEQRQLVQGQGLLSEAKAQVRLRQHTRYGLAEHRSEFGTETDQPAQYPGQLLDAGLLTIPLQLHPPPDRWRDFLFIQDKGLASGDSSLYSRAPPQNTEATISGLTGSYPVCLLIHSFVHSFIFSNIIKFYCVPGPLLAAKDITVNKKQPLNRGWQLLVEVDN